MPTELGEDYSVLQVLKVFFHSQLSGVSATRVLVLSWGMYT